MRSWRSSSSMVVCLVSRSRRTSSSRQYCLVYSRLPKRAAASRRASSGDRPCSMSSSVRRAMWNASSASTSLATRRLLREGRWISRGGVGWSDIALGVVQHAEQDAHVFAELGDFALELAAPCGRDGVELRAVVLLGRAPRGFDEAFALEAVEGLVERGVFDRECPVATVADPARDPVAVHGGP